MVVDSGLVREALFDSATSMTRLTTRRISRASARQREGRAGRLGPGYCYRLWSEELGRDLAEEEGVGVLTEKHWRVLLHVREKFFRIGALPSMRRVCRETALSKAEIYGLFGGCLVIWRIAGLPNPGEEARAYLI